MRCSASRAASPRAPPVVDRLDAAPVEVWLRSQDGRSEMPVDGTALMRLVRQSVALNGSSAAIFAGANVPAMIAAADPLDPRDGQTMFGPFVTSAPYCDGYLGSCPAFHRTTLGVYLTELCRNHHPFPMLDASDAIGRLAAESPYVYACNSWAVEEDPVAPPTTIATAVPVYAVVGEYTPYSDVARVCAFLGDDPHAHVIEVPGWGHNAIAADPCLGEIRQAFFQDPTADLDISCVDSIRGAPEFVPHL